MRNLLFASYAVVAASVVNVQAGIVYQDDFSSDPGIPGAVWDENTSTPASYDAANEEVDYIHTAGTTRRFVNHNTGLFFSTQGYFKADISNFLGDASVWMGFIEDNTGNNGNYATTTISGNGAIEMVVNNSGSAIAYDNGAGWSGVLAAYSGLITTDGGTSTTALTFGAGVTNDVTFKGFGFANFGNATVFPSSSFSIDNVIVSDTAVIPEPATLALAGLGLIGMVGSRGRRA